jgi:catechol 2,3-dioxygenase-like lactoylglutathione lyase family enzyme
LNLFQVNLLVEDFPAMLGFYRDKLGFELNDIAPGPPSVPLVNWASLRTGSVTLELFDVATYGNRDQLHDTGREAVELCFIVDDVDRERIRLEQAGVKCDPVLEEDWGRYAAFRDPEGNRLQLFEVFDTRDRA